MLCLLSSACRADNLAYEIVKLQREITDAREFLAARGVDMSTGQVAAHVAGLAVMQYCARVSVPEWRYRSSHGMSLPGGTTAAQIADDVVAYEAGLCAGSSFLFLELMRRVGYTVRKTDAWYGPPGSGHAMAEVYWGGKWHLYDPLWGRYWRDPAKPWWDIASAEEVAHNYAGDIWEVGNSSHAWRRVCDETSNPDSGLRWWAETPLTIKTGSTVLYSR